MLNVSLYNRLKQAFGSVDIVNENQPIQIEDRVGLERTKRWKVASGEQYRVDCPFCGDTRGRLYLSYAWGMDSQVGFPSSKLVVCHNEHCEADDINNMPGFLQRKLSAYFSDAKHGRVQVPKPIRSAPGSVKVKKLEFPKPEWTIPINQLGRAQISVKRYFQDERKNNLDVLYNSYGVVYAYEYPVNDMGKDYSWLAGRVFIPVFNNGSLIGWQARISDNTTFTKQKYYNCPGWQKSSSIYNLDNARKNRLGLLVEGVTDVWRVGAGAFSTYGKSLSTVQEDIITSNWESVGVLYDPDTDNDKTKSAMKAIMRLRNKVKNVFRINLPDGRDPADCSYGNVWDCIERDAERAGLTVRRPR